MRPNRRQLLRFAALAASFPFSANAARGLRVVVVGAGIVGASIAYHLSMAGAKVTVIDRYGAATRASRGTFAWINATWAKQPRHYHRLNQDSIAEWHQLQRELDIPVRWGGSLEWFSAAERQASLVEDVREQVDWGEPARMVDAAEVTGLAPSLIFPTDGQAAYSPNDGAVDPVLATQRLLERAKALGARFLAPCSLQEVTERDGRLIAVQTDNGAIDADRLVLATGAEPEMASRHAGIDVPQRSTPGVIAITAPLPPLLSCVVSAPGVHMHQRDDGRVVLGEQDGPPRTEQHRQRLAGYPYDFPSPELAREHGRRMLGVAQHFLPALSGAAIESAWIGWRPLPLDGHPVLGAGPARPDVYLAIMHSGVSLAPLAGRLAAREITTGESLASLAPYRPTREFRRVIRY